MNNAFDESEAEKMVIATCEANGREYRTQDERYQKLGERADQGKAMLPRFFEQTRLSSTPVVVERLVADIDGIVKIVRFTGWQDTRTGRNTVKRSLRDVVMVKYRIRDKDLFDRAYGHMEQYY